MNSFLNSSPFVLILLALIASSSAEDFSSPAKNTDRLSRRLKVNHAGGTKSPKSPKRPKSKAPKCDVFPTVSSFDLDRYSGRWYLVYATDSPVIGKRCQAANYVYNPPNPVFGTPPTVSIVNTGFCSPGERCTPPYGVYSETPGSGMPNPGFQNEPGKLLVDLNTGRGTVTFNYWVIDVVSDPTDSTAPYKFAAVADPYYPGGALTYILSREKVIAPSDEKIVAEVLAKVQNTGISLENMVPIVQEPECVYDP